MKKYLIIRFSSIGDIVLTSPVIRCLKEQQPDSSIHFITKGSYRSLVENNPHIDKVYTIEKDIDEVAEELKKENYEFIIDLHNNLRTFRLKRKLGRPAAAFPKLNVRKFILTSFKWDTLPDVHIVDRYFEAAKSLKIANDQKGLDFFLQENDTVNLSEFGISDRYIAYAIGAQYATKKLPNHRIIELIKKIELPVVLLGGSDDLENAKTIVEACPSAVNLAGELSLGQSAYVLKHAKKVITHDTGLMHIAAAWQQKIISIWGNTVPEFGMHPYEPSSPDNYSIHQVDVSCRPCSKIGHQTCPKKHFKCMENQDLNAIASAVNA